MPRELYEQFDAAVAAKDHHVAVMTAVKITKAVGERDGQLDQQFVQKLRDLFPLGADYDHPNPGHNTSIADHLSTAVTAHETGLIQTRVATPDFKKE